ncbi:hypothetical protein Tco_0962099 [Tanacetum coccineum]
MKKIFQRLPLGRDVHFLEHVVNSNGIHVDPSKIEGVKNWKIAKPLTSLTQNNQKLEWAKEQEEAFQTIRLCTRAKRQGRERDSRNAAWPGPTNGKKGRYKAWSACVDNLSSWWKIYFAILANIAKGLRDAIGYKYGLSSSNGWEKVEVGDKVMLEVSSWKDVVHFGKKEMLAPRYYLADTNLHVHLEEIKVDKTLRFAEEPVEIIDREVKSLKRSRIPIVKSIGTRSEVMRIS